jgi:hypothetical protein
MVVRMQILCTCRVGAYAGVRSRGHAVGWVHGPGFRVEATPYPGEWHTHRCGTAGARSQGLTRAWCGTGYGLCAVERRRGLWYVMCAGHARSCSALPHDDDLRDRRRGPMRFAAHPSNRTVGDHASLPSCGRSALSPRASGTSEAERAQWRIGADPSSRTPLCSFARPCRRDLVAGQRRSRAGGDPDGAHYSCGMVPVVVSCSSGAISFSPSAGLVVRVSSGSPWSTAQLATKPTSRRLSAIRVYTGAVIVSH